MTGAGVLPPVTADLVQDLKRSGQILFPKDLGYILLKLGRMIHLTGVGDNLRN